MISDKQIKEVDFLQELANSIFSEKDIEEYFNYTVRGIGKKPDNNIIYQTRRILDIMVKQWKEGIKEGIITQAEIIGGFKNKDFLEGIDWNKKYKR
jgi:hypothetical protein